jgi:type IV pilus assembly protein PilM
MARSPYAWGIDIGKCGLKALRCRLSPTDPTKLIAEAFDYVEYPMILSQPEANPVELVQAALQEFLGRNTVEGDRVALAVPGQMGLAKFIKLPPLESKRIPDIVKYEARQQIPFPMDQVIWDWQRLAGGFEEGGFVMDAEVALFAMKREQVYKALAPLQDRGVEVELLQLAPIALANMIMFDQLPPASTLDPDNPPASTVIVSIGVDSTDLVVTNGLRLWQRSMPIGGNSFTKALVSEMKLTFAKAEHLKRNAVRAEDPKAVFRAMRPVFNDFASDLQRSLNYFSSSDRTATIGKVYLLGNAAKLRGLGDFIAKQLQLDVHRLEKFDALEGPGVVGAPAFRENRLAFGVSYGLALQAVGGSSLRTNLVPREIIQDRMINAKKPWAVAAMAGLLSAALVYFVGFFFAWQTYGDSGFPAAFQRADAVQSKSRAATMAVDEAKTKRDAAVAKQEYLVRLQDRRFQSLEMLRAVRTLLPHDDPAAIPEHPADRREIHVDAFDCQYFPDVSVWFQAVRRQWEMTNAPGEDMTEEAEAAANPDAPADPAATPAAPAAADAAAGDAVAEGDGKPKKRWGRRMRAQEGQAQENPESTGGGPTGPGWVIQIVAHHFHNEDRHRPEEGEQFVRGTIVKNLNGEGAPITITVGPKAGSQVSVEELGIGFPVIVRSEPLRKVFVTPTAPGGAPGGAGVAGAIPDLAGSGVPGGRRPGDEQLELKRHDFVLQFVWQPVEAPHQPIAPAQFAAPGGSGF